MPDDLLERARQQADKAGRSVRAAALLRIARAESTVDASRARQTLMEGVAAVRALPSSVREDLFQEARTVAAAVAPELLAEIPIHKHEEPTHYWFGDIHIIQTMLTYGHANAAFYHVLRHNDPTTFPFFSVGAVLQRLDPQNPEYAARRIALLRHAVELWRQSLSGDARQTGSIFLGHHYGFVGLFGHYWKDFPPDEALSIARTIVDQVMKEPDAGASAGYGDEIHFGSPRQDKLFQILHVLRHLDPALAQSLMDSQDQLALAARRYPNGLETMNEEVQAEADRRKTEAATCEGGTCGCGGYFLTGDPEDFDRQRRIIDAARGGDFQPSIEDAIEKYRQDTSPDAPNYAPKEYWPSTGAFRTVFYDAGRHLGSEAAKLLEQIPDNDLRLFASIELAAALAGVPQSSITSMKHPRPPGSRKSDARIISASCSTGRHRAEPGGPTMRSPDGRLIRCPKCNFQPPQEVRWICKCGHVWNTFWTSGKCPACHFQWEATACPQCGEMSEHHAWYVSAT